MRLILISCPEHLDLLGDPEPGDLFFTSEWLTWRYCTDHGLNCRHYERHLEKWPEHILGNPLEIYLRGATWMYREGVDSTMFRGVSLGGCFAGDVAYFHFNFGRFRYALDAVLRECSPRQVVYFDFHDFMDTLDPHIKHTLASELARRHGAEFVDRQQTVKSGHSAFFQLPIYARNGPPEPAWRAIARRLYARVMEILSSVTAWNGRKPKLLMWVNLSSLIQLVRSRRRDGITPVIIAGAAPKTSSFIGGCLTGGVVLAGLPKAALGRADREAIEGIAAAIGQIRSRDGDDLESEMLRVFIQSRIINSGRLWDFATKIVQYERLFDRHRFERVVVGDLDNPISRIIAELAEARGIPCDELLNGVFLAEVKNPARCGSRYRKATLSRQLAWGNINVRWIKALGSSAGVTVTGYPALDGMLSRKRREKIIRRNALILPIYASAHDPAAITFNVSQYLVDFAAALSRLGFESIRVKIHPGQHNPMYFRRLIDYLSLPCEMIAEGGIQPHLTWADLVVGPAASGAFVETLAAGKPYYAVRPEPSSVDSAYLAQVITITNVGDLIRHVEQGSIPAYDYILDEYCNIGKSMPASAKFWQAMSQSLPRPLQLPQER